MNKKALFIVALLALLVTFGSGTLFYYAMGEKQAPALPEAKRNALVRNHSPSIGNSDAPVVIAEFFDPACETCATFYPRVKEIMAANPGKIRLVLRYAPFHEGSVEIVAMLEAARLQGKFWPALEALLARQAEWAPNHTPQPALALRQLGGLGMDLDKLKADMSSPEISRLITQDIEDARTLNVTMTPEFFVNGKPLPSFGLDQLKKLVADALKQT